MIPPFALRPDRTVGEVFFLPYGHHSFEGIDGVLAGLKRGAPVFRSYHYGYARLADPQAAQAVHDSDAIDRELLFCLAPDLFHLAYRQSLVALVFEMERGAPVRMIPNDPFENDHGPILPRTELVSQGAGRNWVARNPEKVSPCAAAHRRHNCYLITLMQQGQTRRDFLIEGDQERIRHGTQARKTSLVTAPEVFEVLAVGEFGVLLGETRQVVCKAEKKNPNLHTDLVYT